MPEAGKNYFNHKMSLSEAMNDILSSMSLSMLRDYKIWEMFANLNLNNKLRLSRIREPYFQ